MLKNASFYIKKRKSPSRPDPQHPNF